MSGAPVMGPPREQSAALRGLTGAQGLAVALITGVGLLLWAFEPGLLARLIHDLLWSLFLVGIGWRIWAIATARSASVGPTAGRPRALPPYTIIAALRDEAAVVPQLVSRLSRLDYPRDRLRGFIVLEADDTATAAAFRASRPPDWLELIVTPPGRPTTKPRALNIALSRVVDGLVTVYDAEDDPDPGQLKEAAARFATGGEDLACLQAPLRVRLTKRSGWLQRQFAGEYGALFEIVLPALARLDLPFPLGGTSNHFRVDVLREVGGWDASNVTEDADLGFRLWRASYRGGVLRRPTWESPPANIRAWLPQRTRWLKGFLQTLGVHLRDPFGLGARGLAALFLTLGLTIAAAVLQGLVLCWVAAVLLVSAAQGVAPVLPIADVALLLLGWVTAGAGCHIGARLAGVRYRLFYAFTSPFYWALLTVALPHALWRLATQPFHWDKTPHLPDEDSPPTGLWTLAAVIPGPWLQGSPRPLRSSAPAAGPTMASSTAAPAESSKGTARRG